MINFFGAHAAMHSTFWLSTVSPFSIGVLLKALVSGFLVSLLLSRSAHEPVDELLTHNARLFSAFMDNLPAFAWIKDIEGRYIFLNKLALAQLAPSQAEWRGKTDADLWPGEFGATFRSNDLKVVASRKPLETYEFCLLEGEQHCVQVSKFPILDHTGAVIMVGGIGTDLTTHKQAEAENKYRDIFENAGEGIFQSTPDGRFIAANPTLARIHGFESPEELINSCQDITREIYADSDRRQEFKRLLKEHGVVRDFEHQVFRKDESKIWITVNARVVRNEQGEIVYYEGTAQDITERKQAEHDLIKQKEILEKIFNHIPVMINFTDSEGRIKLVNREWERTLGWSLEEVLNGDSDVFAECYPDPEYRQDVLKFIAEANGEWVDFKTRVRDGSVIDTSWARAKLSDGTTIGIGQNITERKRSEESLKLFRSLIDRSNDAIEVLDPVTLRFLDCNATAHQTLGYTREEFLSLTAFDIDPLIDQSMIARLADEMKKSAFVIFESIHQRKDGSTFPVEINAKTIRLGRDYRLAVVRDITERKRAETRSTAFANLAEKLSGAMTPLEAGQIIIQNAHDLFGWDLCTLDLYDGELDVIHSLLNVDTIDGTQVNVAPRISGRKPTVRGRRVIDHGPELILRKEPLEFNIDAVPFGDVSRPSAAIMTAPIRHASRVIGILSIQSYCPLVYDDVAMRDLQALADHCGEALNRIQAEEQLRDSEQRYRDLVENSREFICTHDLDGLILSANRAATEILGHDREDYFGKKNLREILTPAALEGFDDYIARICKYGVASGIMLVQTSSGEERVWEYYNTLRTEGVAAPVVRGMARDISERRRAEEALRQSEREYRGLFENAHDAILIIQPEREIVLEVNQRACEIYGYSRPEFIGMSLETISKNVEQGKLRVKETLECGTSYDFETIQRRGDGTEMGLAHQCVGSGVQRSTGDSEH